MASAVPAAASQAPWTAFESRKVGLVSIVEEELVADCQSPLASPTLQTPQWRDVGYFDNAKSSRAKGLGVTSASHTGSPLVMSSRNSSPGASPNPSSPRLTTLGWGMVPPRQTSPLGTASPVPSPMEIWDKGPSVVPKLSSVIPDISDDEASRHGSIAEIEIILRKASIALSQLDGYTTTKSDIEILINEESDSSITKGIAEGII
ncbi:MAG: Arabinanase/levansucrase/invertase [Aureobasidium pullulans]|nr:MAG: Arabinanase/levansucrase/invertase [Aureobasidium pullulans]